VTTLKIGVQLHPEHTSTDAMRRAWREADAAGFDSIWTWDHFFPLTGDSAGTHFDGYSLLAAMAVETSQARFGALVTNTAYRNPDLLADMARTIDHLSGGRFILGVGAGWFERDHREYGYPFGTKADRTRAFAEAIVRIKERLTKLNPPPVGPMPILVGAGGEQVMLRLVAQHANAWNWFGTPTTWAAKNAVLDQWCEKVGRDPGEIERSILVDAGDLDQVEEYAAAGVQHLIVQVPHPYDLAPAARALEQARASAI
jgi:probable F420-dependent oxidoreductase